MHVGYAGGIIAGRRERRDYESPPLRAHRANGKPCDWQLNWNAVSGRGSVWGNSMNVRNTIRMAVLGLFLNTACALAQPGSAEAREISVYSGVAVGGLGTHAAVGSSVGRAS